MTAADAPPAAILAEGVVKRYRSLTALDAVSFAAPAGAVTALLGPNGAGKTTLVEICEGYRVPDAGTVLVLGAAPGSSECRPRVGVMLQSGVGYPGATPREMLTLLASFARHPHDVAGLLELVGLSAAADRPLRRLSGGEKQRTSLAMALVGRPELVVLDEPTAGMDVSARHQTWQVIADLRRDGVSVLLTTHYLEEAERLADHVVIVDRGRVVAAGHPGELSGEARLTFTAPPGLHPEVGGLQVVESPAGHYTVRGAVSPQAVAALTAWCAERGVLVTDLRTGSTSLEEVFMSLTGEDR
ncbi:MAG: ABC transporter ATP-binding protein [Mycobacteriales bacterium]